MSGAGTRTNTPPWVPALQALSVGNSAKLKQTALVEAFNLRAAIELTMGNPAGWNTGQQAGPWVYILWILSAWHACVLHAVQCILCPAAARTLHAPIFLAVFFFPSGAVAALSDMPPRQEHELDPVTLHNRALAGLAHGGPEAAAAALDKLTHLLAHPPFPPELLGNLLSLCCRSTEDSGLGPTAGNGDGTGAIDPKALAEQLLQEHAPLVAAHVPPELLPLYRACLSRSRSAEEAAAQLDAAAGAHVEGLRRRVKTVQEARWAGDQAAAAAGLEAYEQALEAYIPGGWVAWWAELKFKGQQGCPARQPSSCCRQVPRLWCCASLPAAEVLSALTPLVSVPPVCMQC
jgi:hypothetical protein